MQTYWKNLNILHTWIHRRGVKAEAIPWRVIPFGQAIAERVTDNAF